MHFAIGVPTGAMPWRPGTALRVCGCAEVAARTPQRLALTLALPTHTRTDPASSDSECDICSNDWSGNWEHLHCRGFAGRKWPHPVFESTESRSCCMSHLKDLRAFSTTHAQHTARAAWATRMA